MIWVDYGIILIIGLFSIISFIRGFIQEVLSLLTWGCAFFITNHFYSYLAVNFIPFENELLRNSIAIIIFFVAILMVGGISNYVVCSLIKKSGLSGIDRVLGFFFGVLRGILIVAVILYCIESFTGLSKNKDWQNSQLIPQFNYIISWLFNYFKIMSNFLPLNLSGK